MQNLGIIDYGQSNGTVTKINFSNPDTATAPIYSSGSWQGTLLSQGYTASDIALASTQISKLNIASGTDLVPIAKGYINYSKNIVV